MQPWIKELPPWHIFPSQSFKNDDQGTSIKHRPSPLLLLGNSSFNKMRFNSNTVNESFHVSPSVRAWLENQEADSRKYGRKTSRQRSPSYDDYSPPQVDYFSPGDSVLVIGGEMSHRGKIGQFVNYTEKRACILLPKDNAIVKVFMAPKNLRKPDELNDMKNGDPIRVISGKYTGWTGEFLYHCDVKVRVRIQSGSTMRETHLYPSAVEPIALERPNTRRNKNASRVETPTNVQTTPRATPVYATAVHDLRPSQVAALETSSDFAQGDRVRIISGKYKGWKGHVLYPCPSTVRVSISDGTSVAQPCLKPRSLERIPQHTSSRRETRSSVHSIPTEDTRDRRRTTMPHDLRPRGASYATDSSEEEFYDANEGYYPNTIHDLRPRGSSLHHHHYAMTGLIHPSGDYYYPESSIVMPRAVGRASRRR